MQRSLSEANSTLAYRDPMLVSKVLCCSAIFLCVATINLLNTYRLRNPAVLAKNCSSLSRPTNCPVTYNKSCQFASHKYEQSFQNIQRHAIIVFFEGIVNTVPTFDRKKRMYLDLLEVSYGAVLVLVSVSSFTGGIYYK
jgi:hypothetical protein